MTRQIARLPVTSALRRCAARRSGRLRLSASAAGIRRRRAPEHRARRGVRKLWQLTASPALRCTQWRTSPASTQAIPSQLGRSCVSPRSSRRTQPSITSGGVFWISPASPRPGVGGQKRRGHRVGLTLADRAGHGRAPGPRAASAAACRPRRRHASAPYLQREGPRPLPVMPDKRPVVMSGGRAGRRGPTCHSRHQPWRAGSRHPRACRYASGSTSPCSACRCGNRRGSAWAGVERRAERLRVGLCHLPEMIGTDAYLDPLRLGGLRHIAVAGLPRLFAIRAIAQDGPEPGALMAGMSSGVICGETKKSSVILRGSMGPPWQRFWYPMAENRPCKIKNACGLPHGRAALCPAKAKWKGCKHERSAGYRDHRGVGPDGAHAGPDRGRQPARPPDRRGGAARP